MSEGYETDDEEHAGGGRFDYHPAIRYPLLFVLGPLLIIAAVEAGFSKGWKVDGPIIAGAAFWYSLILMVVL